ncbi:MAG: dockerin type I repeat-containing protein [Muribaculaceae bacterium]|nr:dockerin type I repeat-containing protein [Muribaculaceae bacterium]
MKKIILFLLSAIMVSMFVNAEVTVCGNAPDVNGNFSSPYIQRGTITWDNNSKTLTLDNAIVEYSSVTPYDYVDPINVTEDATIVINGYCMVTTTGFNALNFGSNNVKTIVIRGDGWLYTSSTFIDIYIKNTKLTIKDISLEIVNGIADNGYGHNVALTFDNVQANIKGCVERIREGITFNNCAITYPEDAYIAESQEYGYSIKCGNDNWPDKIIISRQLNYDLWINGEQVTNLNCADLSNIGGVTGTVTYEPSTNTLTLENATLSCNVRNGSCIASNIDGLTINLIGTNSLSSRNGTGANAVDVNTTTINGTGTLSAQATRTGIHINEGKSLTIDNVTDLSIANTKYGIYGFDNNSIVIKGSNTVVHVNCSMGSICNFKDFVLEDGLAITEPEGGYYNDGTLYDANGNAATSATISKPEYYYNLWINGEQVTSANCSYLGNVVGVTGTVTYKPSTKTLTLDNAALVCNVMNESCILSHIDGLTINLIGTNSLSSKNGIGCDAVGLHTTTIKGTGTLSAQATNIGIYMHGDKTLTIDNVPHLSIANTKYGIYGFNNNSIVIKGSNTVVHVNCSMGSICNFKDFVLEDGLAITEPAGGYYNNGTLYDANGNAAKKATISKPGGLLGDLDGSGIVDVEDVNAAINIILKLKTINDYPGNGDMDGNGYIDVEDVNAMINIILKL